MYTNLLGTETGTGDDTSIQVPVCVLLLKHPVKADYPAFRWLALVTLREMMSVSSQAASPPLSHETVLCVSLVNNTQPQVCHTL